MNLRPRCKPSARASGRCCPSAPCRSRTWTGRRALHRRGRWRPTPLGVVGLEVIRQRRPAAVAGRAARGARQRHRRRAGRCPRVARACQGIGQLVLLTQTAEQFFARRGYAVIAREAAPAAVQHSAEFRSICPASATCMTQASGVRAMNEPSLQRAVPVHGQFRAQPDGRSPAQRHGQRALPRLQRRQPPGRAGAAAGSAAHRRRWVIQPIRCAARAGTSSPRADAPRHGLRHHRLRQRRR